MSNDNLNSTSKLNLITLKFNILKVPRKIIKRGKNPVLKYRQMKNSEKEIQKRV